MLSPLHKKWRLFRTWSSRYPVWCAWQVTYRCNFRCGFCQYWKDPAGQLPEQTLEQIREGSRKLAGMGTLMISIGGGEPTLRDDLAEVVAAIAEYHFPFLTTNGYRVTPKLAGELFEAGLWGASISLDHADPAQHDRGRGVKDAYDRAVKALDCFAGARRYAWQRVNLMCVLMHDNLDDIERLIQLAAEHDAYFMVQPYCTRKTGSEAFVCKSSEIGRRLVDLRRRYANFLSNPVFLSRFDEAIGRGVGGCKAGLAFFNIDSRGDVAICVERRGSPVAICTSCRCRRSCSGSATRAAATRAGTAGTTVAARSSRCTIRSACCGRCRRSCSIVAGRPGRDARKRLWARRAVPRVATKSEAPRARRPADNVDIR
jgi:MoaA/NifB/PqqE/SkfB family radical SAM enzyme